MNDCKFAWLSKSLNLIEMYFNFENNLSQATCNEETARLKRAVFMEMLDNLIDH